MGMKAQGADLLFKGGLYNGNRWLALFSATTPTELSGNSYARAATTLASWKADGAGYINDGNINFPAPNPSAWLAIVSYGLYSALTGGTLYYDFDSTDTAAPALGATVGFLDSTIGYRFTGAVTTMGGQVACSAGLLSGTRALSLHSAAPGATGGSQVDDSVTVTAGQWTVDTQAADAVENTPKRRRARNNAIIDWGVQTTDVAQPTHIALRDGTGTSANVLWSDALPGNTDDPSLGDTIQAAANAIQIYIPID